MDAAMTRPTRFQIMRRNRPKVAKARKTLRERIDEIERTMCAEWGEVVVLEKDLAEAQEQLARSRERQLPRPSRLRRLFDWTMSMGAGA